MGKGITAKSEQMEPQPELTLPQITEQKQNPMVQENRWFKKIEYTIKRDKKKSEEKSSEKRNKAEGQAWVLQVLTEIQDAPSPSSFWVTKMTDRIHILFWLVGKKEKNIWHHIRISSVNIKNEKAKLTYYGKTINKKKVKTPLTPHLFGKKNSTREISSLVFFFSKESTRKVLLSRSF